MNVYKAINAVQAELAQTGITKDRRNQQQGYNFRGIDDVFNALSPLLARHGLCILPRVTEHRQTERQTAKGGMLFYTVIKAEFDFVCAEDGSKHTVATIGEAMDSGDKSSNKAMSAAYKYAAFQAFAIPTEADNDADAHTHEVKAPDVSDIIASIKNATNMESLKGNFSAAWQMLDGQARDQAKQAYDGRKAELQTREETTA